jgi:hypothetical protein
MVFSNLPQGPLPVPFSYDLSMVSPFKDTSIDGLESLLVNPIAVCFRLLPPLWSLSPLTACLFKGLAVNPGSGPSVGGLFLQKARSLEPGRRRLVIVLSRLAARPEYSQTQVPPLWVRRSHFAVGHFLGFVVFPEPATLGYG